jgi:hypothetical protein
MRIIELVEAKSYTEASHGQFLEHQRRRMMIAFNGHLTLKYKYKKNLNQPAGSTP